MTNNNIINNLLHKGEQDTKKADTGIAKARVVNIRYRIYVVILLVILFFGLNDFVLPAFDTMQRTSSSLEQMNTKILQYQGQRAQYAADKLLVRLIEEDETQIIDCINNQQGCDQLDDKITNNFSIVRSYLLFNDLSHPKMAVDERILLANINEYLLSSGPSDTTAREKNGTLNKILIGEPVSFTDTVMEVPLEMSVTFADKDALLVFITNAERYVLRDAQYRVLYKIQEVQYDVVNYEEEQDVKILLSAYYYQQ